MENQLQATWWTGTMKKTWKVERILGMEVCKVSDFKLSDEEQEASEGF